MISTTAKTTIAPGLLTRAKQLLRELIRTPSFSREEHHTANLLLDFFQQQSIRVSRKGNNVWVKSRYWSANKPTLLLNSHHDTVKPNKGWQLDPFEPTTKEDQLFGLGSNDAGGALVSLIATFLQLYQEKDLPVNLILAATAEEEISGPNGIASILPQLGPIWAGIVGEPTGLKMAVAERGLVVIDGLAKGEAGHAAREEGLNALYLALEDIAGLRRTLFTKVSDTLGAVKATVTQIEAGVQHNVIPDECRFVIDVRTNEHYTNQEVFELLQAQMRSTLTARSFRLNASGISENHPLVQAGQQLGLDTYGSPTLSDQALLTFPTVKIGPGESARSHTADEYIRLSEIEKGIETYLNLIHHLKFVS